MKILQVNNYGYIKGGSEKVFFETIDILKRNEHQVKACCMDHENNLISEELISIPIKKYEQRNGLWESIIAVKNFFYNKDVEIQFEKLVEEFIPDIIHIHIIYGRLTNAIIKVAEKHKIPIVQSVHEFRLLCPVYTCLDSSHNICERCASSTTKLDCIIKKCSKNSRINSTLVASECKFRDYFFTHQKKISGFIMVSKFIRDKHLQYFPEIKHKCYQIYNSINTEYYKQFVDYSKYNKNRYYLYFGRLSYEKGIPTLVEFFANNPQYTLKIIGSGPLLSEIQQRIVNEKLDNIILLGYQSGKVLYRHIAQAFFTIVPSEWYENNPLSIIESLSLGTPVIGNNIGGIPEIVTHNETGYIYDYNVVGSFERCMNHTSHITESIYNQMIDSCIENAYRLFNNDNYYNQLIDVYNVVITNYNKLSPK